MENFDFNFMTAPEINMQIANNMRNIRRRRKISQTELSKRSGVSLGSLKRFEQTGDISLLSLSKLAIALDLEDELKNLFAKVPYKSLEEVRNERGSRWLK